MPLRSLVLAPWLVLWAAGCAAEPSLYERCGAVCDACGIGYCVAGGGSGHCSDPGRAACIVAAVDDCDEIRRTCIAGPAIDAGPADAGPAADAAPPPDGAWRYERCGAVCDACGVGYCIAGGGSGHCASAERADCILAAGPADCDAVRVCIMGPPPPDAGSPDAP